MKAPNPKLRQTTGATLPEVLIGAVAASIILGGLMTGSVALQRSFSASDRLARAQADLLRVSDYMARDIRNATSINASPSSSVMLSLTTEDYYNRCGTPNNAADDVANSPILGRTGVTYGSNPVTIRYLRIGTRIVREVNRVDAGFTATSKTQIADNVDDLAVTVTAEKDATITSTSSMQYRVRKTGSQAPGISFVMASKPRNPTP